MSTQDVSRPAWADRINHAIVVEQNYASGSPLRTLLTPDELEAFYEYGLNLYPNPNDWKPRNLLEVAGEVLDQSFDPKTDRVDFWPVEKLDLDDLIEKNPSLSYSDFLRFPDAVIQQDFLSFAVQMLTQDGLGAENNTFTYYIDRGGASPFFEDSELGNKYRERFRGSLTLNQDEYTPYIRKVMQDFENATGGRIQFKEVQSDEEALLGIYRTPPSSSLLGVSLDTSNGSQIWRSNFYTETSTRGNQKRNKQDTKATIRHEIGHALGLSHPVDLATFLSGENPNAGVNTAYEIGETKPNHTVMSYNAPPEGDIDHGFSANDVSALYAMWSSYQGSQDKTDGFVLRKSDVFDAVDNASQNGIDVITGTSASDQVQGGNDDGAYDLGAGHDRFVYREGFDFVRGGRGRDRFVVKPSSEHGHLVIEDFNRKKDKIVFKGDAETLQAFSAGGSTIVFNSDTDALVIVKGVFGLEQLTM